MMHKMRIKSDRFNKYKKDKEEMTTEDMGHEAVPVDMYGRQIFPNKNDPKNLENAAADVLEVEGLEPLGLEEE